MGTWVEKKASLFSMILCVIAIGRYQGCGVGVGVGVDQSRGNESGVGVGVDQTASTPTPKRFV